MKYEEYKLKSRKFNKKNALAFAEDLYSKKNDIVRYRPLCEGSLADSDGEEVVCCVLGEMYEYFVGKPLYIKVLTGRLTLNQYPITVVDEEDIATELLKTADMKEHKNIKNKLMNELCEELPSVNDFCAPTCLYKNEEEAYIARAKACSNKVRKIANKFLK